MVGEPEPLEIGLCSWTLQLHEEAALRGEVERFGLRLVHLGLGPLVDMTEDQRAAAVAAFRESPLLISAGMIAFPGENYATLETIRQTGGYVPDEFFEERLARTVAAAKVAETLGFKLLTVHAGFIPERGKGETGGFEKLRDRLRRVADEVGPLGVTLCFETGQESAPVLAEFLGALERPNIGVNFDPANMVLYGKGYPVDAAIRLAPWIKHVHAKDARRWTPAPSDPGVWRGEEAPLGYGDGCMAEVVEALWRTGYRGPLAIECERGATRGKTIAIGISLLRRTALGLR